MKQEKDKKARFSSGRILVAISFQESSNSSIWDELNFENSRYTTVSLSPLGQITGKFSRRQMQHIGVGKIVNINKKNGR